MQPSKNPLIRRIYESGTVTTPAGDTYPLNAAIPPDAGDVLFRAIADDRTVVKTLEVGCAYGLSSLHICSALAGREGAGHTIIDPFQNSECHGVGIHHLKSAGFDFFDLIEERSEFALPRLAERGETFDLVFVDGWHTFDHTLVDCFYGNRLLRTGGYLAIDDTDWPAVRRAADYFLNYPCFEFHSSATIPRTPTVRARLARQALRLLGRKTREGLLSRPADRRIHDERTHRLVVMKKKCADERSWDWHDDRF